jgi:hypothetical protein
MMIVSRRGRLGAGLVTMVALLTAFGAARSDAAPAPAAVPATAPAVGATVPGCSAVATIQTSWAPGTQWAGESMLVTVRNTSARRSTRWTASWTLATGQQVMHIWGAQLSASGATQTAVNLPFNGTLEPGATALFGMNLTGTDPAPAVTCSSDTDTVPPVGDVGWTGTVADSGKTMLFTVGDTFAVTLPADYRPLTVTGAPLALVSSTGGYPTGQPLKAILRAAAAGPAELNTQTDDPCLHATPRCARPVMQWLLHVQVLNSTSPTRPGTPTP